MPVLIIEWHIYNKLPEEEQKEFELVELYIELIIFMSAMSMKMRRGTKIMSGVIDVLRIKRNYWIS